VNSRHVGGQARGSSSGQSRCVDFAVMAHAQLAEAQGAQRVFAALDHAQCFRVTARPYSMREKDRRRRFIPHPQIRCLANAEFSALVSGSSRGARNAMFGRAAADRAKIALVVGVDSVGDGVEFVGLAVTFEDGEQFIFAMGNSAWQSFADVGWVFAVPAFPPLRRRSPRSAPKGECVLRWFRARLAESAITAHIWAPSADARRRREKRSPRRRSRRR